MRSRFVAALTIAAIAVVSAVSIPAASGSGGSASQVIPHLNIRTHTMSGTLDPGTTQNCFTAYCSNFYEHLLRFDENAKVRPSLAVSYTNPAPSTWDFTLRRGVRFWNGDEMTAADVAGSLNYERFPQFNSSIALRNVKIVRALSRYKVRITLKRPDASFPVIMAEAGAIFQKKFQVAAGDKFGDPGTLTMATGPFRVVRFDGQSTIEAVANTRWWRGRVNVQRLTIHNIVDDTAAALAIRAGRIDAGAGYGSPVAMQSGMGTSGKANRIAMGTSIKFWGMNTKLPPFDDIHVRKAVAHAVDRRQHLAVQGGGSPIYTIVTPTQLRSIASPAEIRALNRRVGFATRYPFNLARARAEMAQSKYPNGATVQMSTLAFQTAEAQVLAGQLARIGIRLQVNEKQIGEYLNEFYGAGPKRYTITPGYYACNSDPSGCLKFMLGKDQLTALNVGQWAPRDVEALLGRGLRSKNKAERLAIYTRILERVAQQVPYVPAVLPVYTLMISNKYTYPGVDKLGQDIIFTSPWVLKLRPA